MSNKYYGNLIPNTFFTTKGSGESDLEKHAGSYHMALYDAGIADYNIMVYSSVLPATARLVSPDEVDMPPFGSELKTIMSVSHGIQDEFVSAGVVYAWMYKDENFDETPAPQYGSDRSPRRRGLQPSRRSSHPCTSRHRQHRR